MEATRPRTTESDHAVPYYCENCGVNFPNGLALQRHRSLVHGADVDPATPAPPPADSGSSPAERRPSWEDRAPRPDPEPWDEPDPLGRAPEPSPRPDEAEMDDMRARPPGSGRANPNRDRGSGAKERDVVVPYRANSTARESLPDRAARPDPSRPIPMGSADPEVADGSWEAPDAERAGASGERGGSPNRAPDELPHSGERRPRDREPAPNPEGSSDAA
ncbi:MAG: hypothetical protein L3K03_00075 [Thermoplasmata archaeon]|nr:hypothetical protein [Thermoplasmata archaeon]